LTLFYGLPYLAPEEIEDCFVMDIMSSAPDASHFNVSRRLNFGDYINEGKDTGVDGIKLSVEVRVECFRSVCCSFTSFPWNIFPNVFSW
jgi:hypothetical protein